MIWYTGVVIVPVWSNLLFWIFDTHTMLHALLWLVTALGLSLRFIKRPQESLGLALSMVLPMWLAPWVWGSFEWGEAEGFMLGICLVLYGCPFVAGVLLYWWPELRALSRRPA